VGWYRHFSSWCLQDITYAYILITSSYIYIYTPQGSSQFKRRTNNNCRMRSKVRRLFICTNYKITYRSPLKVILFSRYLTFTWNMCFFSNVNFRMIGIPAIPIYIPILFIFVFPAQCLPNAYIFLLSSPIQCL